MEQIKLELLKLVGENKIDEVFNKISELNLDSESKGQIVVIQNKFTQLQEGERKGILYREDINVRTAQINDSLAEFINNLNIDSLQQESQESIVTDTQESTYEDVIVWYAESDAKYAEEIFKYLSNHRLKPTRIDYKKSTLGELSEYIKKSLNFVTLISKESLQLSGSAENHLKQAIDKNKAEEGFLILIRLDEADGGKTKYGFEDSDYKIKLSLQNGNNIEEKITQICERVMKDIAFHIGFNDFESIRKDSLKEITRKANQKYIKNILSYDDKRILPRDYVEAGLHSFACKHYEEALKRFNHALNLNFPEQKRILSKIGACLIRLGKFDDAERVLYKSIGIDDATTYPLSWYNLGILQKAQKGFNDAIDCFQKAIDQMQNQPFSREYILARNNQATTYVELYKRDKKERYLDEAIETLKIINKVGNDFLQGLTSYNLSCIYSLKGENQQALSFLKKSVETDPKNILDVDTEEDLYNLKNHTDTKDAVKKLLSETLSNYKKRTLNYLVSKIEKVDSINEIDEIKEKVEVFNKILQLEKK